MISENEYAVLLILENNRTVEMADILNSAKEKGVSYPDGYAALKNVTAQGFAQKSPSDCYSITVSGRDALMQKVEIERQEKNRKRLDKDAKTQKTYGLILSVLAIIVPAIVSIILHFCTS